MNSMGNHGAAGYSKNAGILVQPNMYVYIDHNTTLNMCSDNIKFADINSHWFVIT